MRTTVFMALTLSCLVAAAQDRTATEIVDATIDAIVEQDKWLVTDGFALYLEGESIESREPNRSRAYEWIAAAGPGYYYTATNRRRIQETTPQITDINQMQFHADKWFETVKFDGQPRLVRKLDDSLIYQPASVRDSQPLPARIEERPHPSLQRLLAGLTWASPPDFALTVSFDQLYRGRLSLAEAQYDAGNVIAVFSNANRTTIMTLGKQVGYMPIRFNTEYTRDGAVVMDIEAEIRWQKSGSYWLPDQIKHTERDLRDHAANDMALAWEIGGAASKLVPGKDDYRATIMEAFDKPYSRIVDGKIIPRPYRKGPKSLFPLSFQPLLFKPTAGEAIVDDSAARAAVEAARQAEQQIYQRFAVLIESECYKDSMQYAPAFTNRWAEQRIYAQLGDRLKYGAYNQISGPKKDKHLWEELLQEGKEIKYRSDYDVFPPGDLRRAQPYTGIPERFSTKHFMQLKRRVTPFYPAGGCFGGQSVFNISGDVSSGVMRGELVAARRLPDGTIRSYWQYTDPDSKPPLDLRGVLVHDPDAGFMPTQATWHGTYPSRMQTEWSKHGDIYLPQSTRVIKPIGHSGDVAEMHQINIYRWLIGSDAPDSLFDAEVADLRGPVMDFFDRPFTRTTADSNLRAPAVYQTPPELAGLSDPPNEAPEIFLDPLEWLYLRFAPVSTNDRLLA